MPAEPKATVRLSLAEDDNRALTAYALVHAWIERELGERRKEERQPRPRHRSREPGVKEKATAARR